MDAAWLKLFYRTGGIPMKALLWKVVFAAAVAAVLVTTGGAKPKEVQHWNYRPCNLVIQYCIIG